jgi:hypothetical protein
VVRRQGALVTGEVDAAKSGWSTVAIHVNAIQEQDVKMYIHVGSRSEALDWH